MDATLTYEREHREVTSIVLVQPRSGLQIRITPSRDGFVIDPGEEIRPVRFHRLAWEVLPVGKEEGPG